MAFKSACDSCGRSVLGIFSSLKKINGRYLCPTCATNPSGAPKYYCNFCHNYTPNALMRGNGWIELILYLMYFIPGVIYSIWRRNGPARVCPLCKTPGLVAAAVANGGGAASPGEARDEIECPYCAEKILAKAKICKHCGMQIQN